MKATTESIRPGVKYTTIECRECLQMPGMRCRNIKTLVNRKQGEYCQVRVDDTNRRDDAREEERRQRLEEAKHRVRHLEDTPVSRFLLAYCDLVRRHGIAFGHEDTHGGFRLHDTNLDHLLAWALDADIELTPPSCATLLEEEDKERLQMAKDSDRVLDLLNLAETTPLGAPNLARDEWRNLAASFFFTYRSRITEILLPVKEDSTQHNSSTTKENQMGIRRFMSEDRSMPERAGETRLVNLSLQQLLEVTDFSEEEVDKLADLKVGESLKVGRDEDLYFERTE